MISRSCEGCIRVQDERAIIVNIKRSTGDIARYQIDFEPHLTVKRLLDRIYAVHDRTLAYRHFCCNNGKCMSCLVQVNDKVVQACKHVLEAGAEISLDAAKGERIIKDLVIDFGGCERRAIPTATINIPNPGS